MNKEQYYKLFETDENDAFVRLIIPANNGEDELNLIGRKATDLSENEVVRAKKYSQMLLKRINNISEELSRKVETFAKKHGYENAEYLCEWNGFRCFEPIFNEVQPSYVGAPLLILVDANDNIRMATYDESMQQIKDSE